MKLFKNRRDNNERKLINTDIYNLSNKYRCYSGGGAKRMVKQWKNNESFPNLSNWQKIGLRSVLEFLPPPFIRPYSACQEGI